MSGAAAMRGLIGGAVLVGVLAASAVFAGETTPTAEQLRFFEMQVRPLLAANCYKCHGAEKQKGGLRVDSLTTLLTGGDSGAAVVPGKPDESLLIEAINYGGSVEMPPTGKLKDDEIALLTEWVRMGAPWPAGESVAASAPKKEKLSDEDRAFWSFQPLTSVAVPKDESGWSRNEIDHFVIERLRTEGLKPAPEADRRTLIRRLYFDLIGLPPTPEEVEAFVREESPQAYEYLVDRLLDDSRYGERWARYWLDLVRYAESDGYKADDYRPHAWRYRDYVIQSMNEDKPYDQFITEQLAGDELAPDDLDARVATGFLRLWIYEYNQRDVRTQWSNILNDMTDVTGDVFLGLGMGCARCHDHKFDPILQDDYFRLQAFFTPLLPRDDLPMATQEQVQEYQQQLAHWEELTADIRSQIAEIEAPYRRNAERGAINKFPKDIQPLLRKTGEDRTPYERQIADLAYRQVLYEFDRLKFKKEDQEKLDALKKELAKYDDQKPEPLSPATCVTDIGPTAPPTDIPGDREQDDIAPGFLSLLDPNPATIDPVPSAPESTGRRTALARWLTSPDNPLTTRVIVNRIWQQHFGTGLVATPSDFGKLGDRPSHPELLDWLTRRFLDDGWRLKPLHRLIVTSATYRQSATHPHPEPGTLRDPANRLLWRANVHRLEAEQIRDAMLVVSGQLDPTAGGPSVPGNTPRRSIYTKVLRNTKEPLLDVFDVPDGIITTPKRNTTTTAPQALLMMNGDWILDRAKGLAARVREQHPRDVPQQIAAAYRWAYGREPTDDELQTALKFLQQQTRRTKSVDTEAAENAAFLDFCHVLLNSNEFLYVD